MPDEETKGLTIVENDAPPAVKLLIFVMSIAVNPGILVAPASMFKTLPVLIVVCSQP